MEREYNSHPSPLQPALLYDLYQLVPMLFFEFLEWWIHRPVLRHSSRFRSVLCLGNIEISVVSAEDKSKVYFSSELDLLDLVQIADDVGLCFTPSLHNSILWTSQLYSLKCQIKRSIQSANKQGNFFCLEPARSRISISQWLMCDLVEKMIPDFLIASCLFLIWSLLCRKPHRSQKCLKFQYSWAKCADSIWISRNWVFSKNNSKWKKRKWRIWWLSYKTFEKLQRHVEE